MMMNTAFFIFRRSLCLFFLVRVFVHVNYTDGMNKGKQLEPFPPFQPGAQSSSNRTISLIKF